MDRARFSRILSRMRAHRRVDRACSSHSTVTSESAACSTFDEEDCVDPPTARATPLSKVPSNTQGPAATEAPPAAPDTPTTQNQPTNGADDILADNIDFRYAGQCLTPEQLPSFCRQLHQLVDVIRNIQEFARLTGEYPAALEQSLEREAREVAALAAEAQNARDVIERTRAQARALHAHRRELARDLAALSQAESRELEGVVRADRKLLRRWEAARDAGPAALHALADDVTNKQYALECLMRLIDNRRAAAKKGTATLPLPPPLPRDSRDESIISGGVRKTRVARRRGREPRSVPLSSQPSTHAGLPQITLYIQGSEPRNARSSSVAVAPLELPSGGSVRDILFFTTS